MRQKLFTVEDRFKTPGRGTVVTSFHSADLSEDLSEFKLESPIVLVLPEGREIMTSVGGVERFQTVRGKKGIGILIKNVAKEDIPIGTEVFLEA